MADAKLLPVFLNTGRNVSFILFRNSPNESTIKGQVSQTAGNRGPQSLQHFPQNVQNGFSHQSLINGPTQGQYPVQHSQSSQGTPQKVKTNLQVFFYQRKIVLVSATF